jgi:tyrosyl-tRNA synthetase
MFQKRLENETPISMTEFLYPLMVGYDSVMLDVDFEVGGNDQLFNMLAGRTLQTALGKRDKFVLTTKLIEGTDGRKMSKTYNNCVYLDDTPEDMYGRLLSIPDKLIPLYMECCTDVPMADVAAAEKALTDGTENPKNLKMHLAREIVSMYHSDIAAKAAEENFENVFKNKGVPENMSEYKSAKDESLLDALLASGSVSSKSDARRLITQGGIKVDDRTVSSIEEKAQKGIVKVGKRKFLRII